MKCETPIEEIWRIRDELSAQDGYDVHQLFQRLRREESKYAGRLVRVVPRRAGSEPAATLREEPPGTKT